jgi:hypothetical protein
LQRGRSGRQRRRPPPAQRQRSELQCARSIPRVQHDRRVDLAGLDALDELERAVDTQLQLPVSQLAADRPEASTVAALLLLVPAVTSIASAATLGETLHPATLVGMVVAIVGVGTVLRREAPRSRRIWRANRCPVG